MINRKRYLEGEPYDAETLAEIEAETLAVEKAIDESVREALWTHKRLGNPIVICRDGQVVWIPAEEIPVDDERPPTMTNPARTDVG
jgi:hypothetical protein